MPNQVEKIFKVKMSLFTQNTRVIVSEYRSSWTCNNSHHNLVADSNTDLFQKFWLPYSLQQQNNTWVLFYYDLVGGWRYSSIQTPPTFDQDIPCCALPQYNFVVLSSRQKCNFHSIEESGRHKSSGCSVSFR